MTREIVLDTETTGLDPAEGHRVVEIGAVELMNHVPTGRVHHVYINPGRPMPPEAEAVHGLTDAFLADKPVFAAVAEAFVGFVAEARLVIHNAAFDMRFLNAEFERLGLTRWPMERAVDTVAIARRKYPGSPANLDALCRRFGVDNSGREKHGALLDAELLAEVYLHLIGGRQPGFALGLAAAEGPRAAAYVPPPRPRPRRPLLTAAEAEAHAAFVETLGEGALWRRTGG
ncbi:MAG: DNA polymerase III subunit epsilon [Rhodobacteraceae bacterium]|nr:MAG: DNA polymerase III subunit epsilon [Paracoccaceae bacterium]